MSLSRINVRFQCENMRSLHSLKRCCSLSQRSFNSIFPVSSDRVFFAINSKNKIFRVFSTIVTEAANKSVSLKPLPSALIEKAKDDVSFLHFRHTMTQNTLRIGNLELGTMTKPPERIYGGFLHSMWRIDTNKSSFAIKQLARDVDLAREENIKSFNLAEKVASQFHLEGIPAVAAIKQNENEYVTVINGRGFLVYPWLDAKPISANMISEKHSLQIASILAKMHTINLHVPEILAPEFDIHTHEAILECINQACFFGCGFASQLKQSTQDLLEANRAFHNSIATLEKNVVVSHADLDPKNVLWNTHGAPFIIDWESIRKLNPTYEIVNASLDWSGITTSFNKRLFTRMLLAYQQAGGILDKAEFEASFYGVLGNWLNWMIYNIKRSCQSDDTEQKKMGTEQAQKTLQSILHLQSIISDLLKTYPYSSR